MKHQLSLIVILLSLTGCAKVYQEPLNSVDQCVKERLFKECMAALPVGPTHTQYNDWDEVVDSCNQHAYYTALRKYSSIPLECRSE